MDQRERLTKLFLEDSRTAGPSIVEKMSGELPKIAVTSSEPDPKKWDNNYVIATATALVAHRREEDPFFNIRPELDYLEDFSAGDAHLLAIQQLQEFNNLVSTLDAAYWEIYDNLDGLDTSERIRVCNEFVRSFAIQSIADRVRELPEDSQERIMQQLDLIDADNRLSGNPGRQLDYRLTRFLLERRAELSRAQMCQLVSMSMALEKANFYRPRDVNEWAIPIPIDLTQFSHLEPDLAAEVIQYLEDNGIQGVPFETQHDGSVGAQYELQLDKKYQSPLLIEMLNPGFRTQVDRYEVLSRITAGRFPFDMLFRMAKQTLAYSKEEPVDDRFCSYLVEQGFAPEEIKQISDLISEE